MQIDHTIIKAQALTRANAHQLRGGQSQTAPPNANTSAADPPEADPPNEEERPSSLPPSSDPPA